MTPQEIFEELRLLLRRYLQELLRFSSGPAGGGDPIVELQLSGAIDRIEALDYDAASLRKRDLPPDVDVLMRQLRLADVTIPVPEAIFYEDARLSTIVEELLASNPSLRALALMFQEGLEENAPRRPHGTGPQEDDPFRKRRPGVEPT